MVYKIYTDGACSGNPGPGGWAAVFSKEGSPEPAIKVLCGNEARTTNNRMELVGVITALEKIARLATRQPGSQFTVYSDSAYVVNAINLSWLAAWKFGGWKTTKGEPIKNSDLWIRCDQLLAELRKAQVNFSVQKVKGHNGDPMNEYADRIARDQSMRASGKGGKT